MEPASPEPVRPPRGGSPPHRGLAALAAEAAAVRLLDALAAADVDALVLKGPSVDRWLYAAEEDRRSTDLDLLVAPAAFPAAERVLAARGYRNRYDGPAPAWAFEHADAWAPPDASPPVDLHRRLWGVGAPPAAAWAALWGSRAALSLGGRSLPVLGEPARALAVALHAAHHGLGAARPLADLARAAAALDLPGWRDAAALARELEAVDGLAAGLAQVPEGRRLAAALGLPEGDRGRLDRASALWSAPRGTEGFLRLGDVRGRRARAALLRREALPSAAFMREVSDERGLARRGRLGLAAAYPVRWARLAVHAPAGVRAAARLRAARDDARPVDRFGA